MIWTRRWFKLMLLAGFGALAVIEFETGSKAEAETHALWGSVATTIGDVGDQPLVSTGRRHLLLLSAPLTSASSEQLATLSKRFGLVLAAPLLEQSNNETRGRQLALFLIAPDGSVLVHSHAATPVVPINGVTLTRANSPEPLDTVEVDGIRLGIAAIGDAEMAIPRLGDRGADLILLTGGPVTRSQIERFAEAARVSRVALLIAGDCGGTSSCIASAAVDNDGAIDWTGRKHAFAPSPRWSPPSAAGLPHPVPQPSRYRTSPALAELGRALFFDKRISDTSSVACASCHVPALGFSDGRAVSAGAHERATRRNAPSLLNVAFRPTLRWDGYATSLENFIKYPMSGSDEMDSHDLDGVAARISRSPDYRKAFTALFGAEPIRFEMIEQALATYMRTLISGDSPFDRAVRGGERSAMPESAWRGYALFTGRAGCVGCHSVSEASPFFTDSQLHNTGLGWNTATSRYRDIGAGAIGASALSGSFRTPTLRDVARTAPYMHDGSIATLREVIDYFDRGGGNGPARDSRLTALHLSERDKQDLEAFLLALTGTTRFDGIRPARNIISDPGRVPCRDERRRARTLAHRDGAGHLGTVIVADARNRRSRKSFGGKLRAGKIAGQRPTSPRVSSRGARDTNTSSEQCGTTSPPTAAKCKGRPGPLPRSIFR